MKKMLALLLAAMMLLAAIPAFADGPVEITMLLEGNNVTDDAAVLEKLNAYLTEKIGVTLKPTWGTWGNFDQLALDYVNSSSNEYDILFTCSWTSNEYAKYAKKDAYVRLDDPEDNLLEKYGQELCDVLPAMLIEGAKTEGIDGEKGIYAVPGFKDIATLNTWDVNVTLLEKYGYTLDDVKNAGFYGWGDIFKTVKEGEEKDGEVFYPFVFEGLVAERCANGTPIVTGDGNSLLSYYMNTEDVSAPGAYGNVFFNKYATPEFEKFAKQMREYYLAGYIDPAIAIGETATDTWRNAQNTGRYLISTEVYSYGYEATTRAQRGIDLDYVWTTATPYIDTTSLQGAMMAISSKSEHPEEAMKFLNLLNTDPYVMTLLNFGVEGIHYTLNEIGEVVFNADARATYSPWTNGVGNVTILPPQKGQGADYQKNFAEFYGNAKTLPIVGFAFDSKPMETEIAAVANVKEAYALSLCTGAVDPETALPELLGKLEAAGMQKIVDEANAQLKAFLGE